MMGASTYDGTYIAAKAIENTGTLNKADIRQALVRPQDAAGRRIYERRVNLVFPRLP